MPSVLFVIRKLGFTLGEIHLIKLARAAIERVYKMANFIDMVQNIGSWNNLYQGLEKYA